jgi:hypothetical protein
MAREVAKGPVDCGTLTDRSDSSPVERSPMLTVLLASMLIACDGGEEKPTPPPPPPIPTPEPEPEPEPSALPEPEVAEPQTTEMSPISFTPEPVCQGGQLVTLVPPCLGDMASSAFELRPGRRAGIIHSSKPLGLADLCQYGFAAKIGDDQLAWWPSDKFSSMEAGKAEISQALNEACEPFSWSAGLISLTRGKPASVMVYDPRFLTAEGIQVGKTTLSEVQALLPGGKQELSLLDGSISYTTSSLSVSVPGAGQPVDAIWFSLLGLQTDTPIRGKAKTKAKLNVRP